MQAVSTNDTPGETLASDNVVVTPAKVRTRRTVRILRTFGPGCSSSATPRIPSSIVNEAHPGYLIRRRIASAPASRNGTVGIAARDQLSGGATGRISRAPSGTGAPSGPSRRSR